MIFSLFITFVPRLLHFFGDWYVEIPGIHSDSTISWWLFSFPENWKFASEVRVSFIFKPILLKIQFPPASTKATEHKCRPFGMPRVIYLVCASPWGMCGYYKTHKIGRQSRNLWLREVLQCKAWVALVFLFALRLLLLYKFSASSPVCHPVSFAIVRKPASY